MGSCFHKVTESCSVCDVGYIGEMRLLATKYERLLAEHAVLKKALRIIHEHKPTEEACAVIAEHALTEIGHVC